MSIGKGCFLVIHVPVDEFDVVEEGESLGVIKCGKFQPLTNFTFKFVHKVVPPVELKNLSGFLVEVIMATTPGSQSKG